MARRSLALALVAGCLAGAGSASAQAPLLVTLAGNGSSSPFPGGTSTVSGTSVPLGSAYGVAPDPFDNNGGGVVFSDPLDNRLFRLTANGDLTLLAGNGVAGYIGDNMTTTPENAEFRAPSSVAAYRPTYQSYFLIADTGNHCMMFEQYGLDPRYVSHNSGQCSADTPFAIVDGTNPTYITLRDVEPMADSSGYYVADGGLVRFLTQSTGSLATILGNGSYPPADGTATGSAGAGAPQDVAATSTSGDYYVATASASGDNGRVLHVTGGKVYTVAGGGSGALGDGGAATSATLATPSAVVLLADGGYLIYDAGHARIRRVSSGGTITTIAGNGTAGSSPDGTPADQASIAAGGRLAVIDQGVVFTQGVSGPAGLVRMLPATSIVSGPSSATQSTSADFTLGSWDSSATFQCKLDTGTLGTCQSYSNLGEGQHTFFAQATTDGSRVDSQGVTRTWIVDHTPPTAPAPTGPADGSVLGTLSPTFTWQPATDARSGIDHYDVLVDGSVAGTVSSCDTTCSFTAGPLTEAAHSWRIRAVDRAGNTTTSAASGFTISIAPVATLVAAPARALVGHPVTLDASGSSDVGAGIARFEFDSDGDHTFETDNGTNPKLVVTFPKPQTLTVGVRVTDGAGLSATATAPVTITATPTSKAQLGVSINDGAQFTNDPRVTVFCVWPAFASDALISNDGGFKNAVSFPVADQIPWTLDSSGPERLPKTIYVRFTAGDQVSETYQDDIILDQIPPKVEQAAVTPAAASASGAGAARVRAWKVRVKASDSNSGVGSVQITTSKSKPGPLIKYRPKLIVRSAKPPLYIRARDRAGNFSPWRKAARR